MQESSLIDVFEEFSEQTGFHFAYSSDILRNTGKVSINMKNRPLSDVLQECLKHTNLWYRQEGDIIVISPKFERQTTQQKDTYLTGVVKDKTGDALPGVTVMVKGVKLGTSTDSDGRFKILLPPTEKTVLVFSFVGMKTSEFTVKDPKHPITITLEEEDADLDEVVVTGIYTRKKESFT